MNKDTNDPIANVPRESDEPLRAAAPAGELADADLSGEDLVEGEAGAAPGSTANPPPRTQPALMGLLVLLLVAGLSLFAFGALNKGDQKGGDHDTIPPVLLTPIAQLDPKLASVLTELQAIYFRDGAEKAREFAIQSRLMDDKEVIRLAVDLDTEDPAEQEEVVKQLEAWNITIYNRYKNTFNISFTLTQAGTILEVPTPGPGTPVTIPTALVGGQLPPTILSGMSKLKRVVRVYQPLPYTTKDVSLDTLYEIRPQGMDKIHAEDWLKAGITGKGMKIGVLDPDGFTGYQDMLGQELPQNVKFKAFSLEENIEGDQTRQPIARSHGAACAEIVHAMAPDAELYLAYFDGSGNLAGSEERAANWLVEQGVTIISASYGSHGTARDGKTSPSTKLVDALSEKGIFWAVSSGNEAGRHYRGTFKAGPDGLSNIFYNGTSRFKVTLQKAGQGIFQLQWDDWEARNIDLSLILLREDESRIFASIDVQDGSAASRPSEAIWYSLQPGTYYLAIASTQPVNKALTFDLWSLQGPGGFEKYSPEASLGTPADARGAFTVGAINWNSEQITDYSSQGPTDDGRVKPDIAAPSDVTNRTFGTFSGTSASAPFVAGAAALIWSTDRNLTSEQIKQLLIQRAKDTGAQGLDPVYGVGKLDMGAVPNGQVEVPTPGPTPGTVPTAVPIQGGTTGSGGSGNGMLLVMVLGGALVALSLVGGIGIWLLSRRKTQAQPAYAMPGQYPPQYPQSQYPPQQYSPGHYPGPPPSPPQPPPYADAYQQPQPGHYPGQPGVPPSMPPMPGYVPPPMAQGPGLEQPILPGPLPPMPAGPLPPQPGGQPSMPGGPGGMAPPPPAQGGFPPPPSGSPPQVPGQGPLPGPGPGGRPAPPPPRQSAPCPNCGRPLKPGAGQCDNCGWKKS
jgi:hypothetical protein